MRAISVIVTGAAGFIGRHVCRALAGRGHRVLGIGHGGALGGCSASWGIARWCETDLSIESLDALAGEDPPRALVHCAGTGAVSRSYAAPYEEFCRSVQTTAIVLEFVRKRFANTTRVVLVSSAAVYGDQGGVDLSESAPRQPVSPYGFSKLAAEDLCDSYGRFFGVSASVVRLFSVYGEGLRKQLLWDAMEKFSRGEARFFGTGLEMRDWIHVEDAAELLCEVALCRQGSFEIYNGGYAKATTREVIEKLAVCAGMGVVPSFTGEVHAGNPRRLTSDSARAQRNFEWKPRIDLDTGLARYVRWYRSEVKA